MSETATIRAVIFGAGIMGRSVYQQISKDMPEVQIVAFADNLESLWGTSLQTTLIPPPEKEIPVIPPTQLHQWPFDRIFVATTTGFYEVQKQLAQMGVSPHKMDLRYSQGTVCARACFVKDFSFLAQKAQLGGSVAEAGVYRGEFAAEINRFFPDRTLYLFDTFEGFPENDCENANEVAQATFWGRHFANTSEQIVLDKLPHPEKAVIRKGYFPDTAVGIEDEFCFVNLDMDLYQPTLEALRFFYPKMVAGGIILIHDYFNYHGDYFSGIEKSVEQFETERGAPVNKLPAGDGVSLAIIKG